MVNSALASPSKFIVESDSRKSNSLRWTDWIRRFEVYIEATGIVGERVKIATLLHVAGEEIESIYESIRVNCRKKG